MKPDEIKRYYSTDDMLEVGARQLNFGPRDEYVLAADHDRVVAALAAELATAHANANEWCAAWNARGHEVAALTERLREAAVLFGRCIKTGQLHAVHSPKPPHLLDDIDAWLQREEGK